MKWPFRKEIPEQLKPGNCECGHGRCSHRRGGGRCSGQFPPDKETPEWTICTCQIYIRDSDNDGSPEPETPTPSELEKLYRQ